MQNQSDIIKKMPHDALRKQLLLSQGLFILIGLILSFFLFDDMGDWLSIFSFDGIEILLYGGLPAVLLVGIEIILYAVLPQSSFDDGGINEKIFRGESIGWIFLIALVVAISEEILFRGVIQNSFGYVFASSLFALIHVRYLKKPVLFILVVLTSFLIGYLFLITNNLLVTIAFHFIVDFLLGLYVKYTK